MQMKTLKFPYSAVAEVAMSLDDLGMTTGHVNHGGVQTYYLHENGERVVGAIIRISHYGDCRVMVREDKAQALAETCDLLVAENW